MTLNLVGQTASGNTYRLRDAIITVRGPTSIKVWNTEQNRDQTSLSADVVTGDYTATLRDGWRIERVEGPSSTTLPSQLLSANPVAFTVAVNQRTAVPLRFRVENEDVDLTQGYDITLVIDEPSPPVLVITNEGTNPPAPSIAVFSVGAIFDIAPLRRITGPSTTLLDTQSVAVANGEIFVCDAVANAIDVFPLDGDGDLAPIRRIAGTATGLFQPVGIAVSGGELFVGQNGGVISVFPSTASGDVAPTRTITGLFETKSLAISDGELYVTTGIQQTISVFPIAASGHATPTRTIAAPSANASFCPVGLAIRRGEIFVTDTCLGGVRVLPQGASGTVAALREIRGDHASLFTALRLAVFRGEIYVGDLGTSSVRVFPATGNGDIGPSRVIGGPNAGLSFPSGLVVF